MAHWDAEGVVRIWVPNTNLIANILSTSVSSSGTPYSPTDVDAPLKAHKIPIAALFKALMDVAFYEEIHNIFRYFIEEVYGDAIDPETGAPFFPPGTKIPAIPGAPDRDVRLQHFAQVGKKWKNTIVEKVDIEAYVYRLALEWARLNVVDRQAMMMKSDATICRH
ncbi:hypothetical protein F5878DRAFT_668944 [Lentinula raphanica]|uniref:Uncharacterized protein n=1 Tax=Lentinula raphanica TaxID=153919 RepID=A0AA38PEQ5_9AGAR|nr:hypothetical protein F5878DRAFT_668944 [Lentinula raphanica]